MGFIGSAIMGGLMAFWSGGRIIVRRRNYFVAHYEPVFKKFFGEITPGLRGRLEKG